MILLKNPMQLFHTGLQMSFLAVLTLSAAAPFFRKFYQGIFLSSGVVQLGLLPYTAYVFNYVSLAAVFINVPIIFLAGFLVPLGIGGFALSLILLEPTAVSIEIMGQAIDGLCGLLTSCNKSTARITGGILPVVAPVFVGRRASSDPAETEESRSCTDLFMPGSSGDIRAGDCHRI